MTDEAIVGLYWQRSEEAIAQSDRKYGGYCFAVARNICASSQDAEECVNDTWLKAWGRMPDERPRSLRAYFGVITRNTALNLFRAAGRKKRGGGQTALALEELEECIPAASSVEREIELYELERAVDGFLATLPERERTLFLCRYWYMSPVAELAKKFGYSQSKTKSVLYRTRIKLRDHLQEEGLC